MYLYLRRRYRVQEELYWKSFATAHWLDKSDGIRVIIPKIMRYSLFELDGVRVHG